MGTSPEQQVDINNLMPIKQRSTKPRGPVHALRNRVRWMVFDVSSRVRASRRGVSRVARP
ncbi:MAG TPA: hypothetical protein VK387_06240 [Thermoleophilaceae bacterium]|nr:hypothetical protein [Thermoleophilaceae bacterium]